MTEALRDLLAKLPKTETHLHIEGALCWDLLQKACPGKYEQVPASWADDFRFDDFAHFERELLTYAGDYFTSAERYHENAARVFAEHLEANVRYVETSFASGCIEFFGLNCKEVLEALRAAVPSGLEVRFFLGIHHVGYHEGTRDWLEKVLEHPDLDGIDLHGPEDAPMGDWAPGYYERARQAGKFTKAHAGEFCGPDFVRYCLDELGAQRIQHGERADEDPELVTRLAEAGVGLDMCPISNVKLGVTEARETHSIRALYDAGVRVTVSRDDPISFGNSLLDEYAFLAQDDHFSTEELLKIARHGFEQALLDEAQKASYLAAYDEALAAHA